MRYFRSFPTISYSTPEIINGTLQEIVRNVPNMSVQISSTFEPGSFTWHVIQERDRPDTLAAKWYNSSRYAWVVMLSNNMRDLYDWPMTETEFAEFINTKYSTYSEVTAISLAAGGSGYMVNDIISIPGPTTELVVAEATAKILTVNATGGVLTLQLQTSGAYKNTALPTTLNNIPTMSPRENATYGTGLRLNLSTETITGVIATQRLIHQYRWKPTTEWFDVDKTFYYSSDASVGDKTIISVYEYERNLNDARYKIKQLTPTAFRDFVNQFNTLVGSSE